MKIAKYTLVLSFVCSSNLTAAEFFNLGPGFVNDVSADGSTVVGGPRIIDGVDFVMFRWTEESGFIELGKLPGRENTSAHGVSADGNVVVGSSWSWGDTPAQPFIWAAETGTQGIDVPPGFDSGRLSDVSADGTVAAGMLFDNLNGNRAFRWTAQDGIQILDPPAGFTASGASHFPGKHVSADGNTIVGSLTRSNGDDEAYVWTEQSGFEPLGTLPGADGSFAVAVSGDGRVAVGGSGGLLGRTFRWTAEERMVDLGYSGRALTTNRDGSVIGGMGEVGGPGSGLIWDEINGPRDLRQILVEEHGFSALPELGQVNAMSDDARTIVGSFTLFVTGEKHGYVVNLDRPIVVTSGVVGDFNGNAELDVEDLDLLVAELQSDRNVELFDVNSDENVDHTDLTQWLSDAAVQDGFAESYLPGDANLDGVINASDLNALGFHWLQAVALWSAGDFTADGRVNAADLNALGKNWLKELPLAAAQNTAVAEPSSWLLAWFVLAVVAVSRRFHSTIRTTTAMASPTTS